MSNILPFPEKPKPNKPSEEQHHRRFNEPNLSPKEAGDMHKGPDGTWQCGKEREYLDHHATHNDADDTHPK